jgi:hypothetical protein
MVETMLKLHKDLPKAKTPHVWADGLRLTAYGQDEVEIRAGEGAAGG